LICGGEELAKFGSVVDGMWHLIFGKKVIAGKLVFKWEPTAAMRY